MSLTTRLGKGSKLTIQEMDENLNYLDGRSNTLDGRVDSADSLISGLTANSLIGYPMPFGSFSGKYENTDSGWVYTLNAEDAGKIILTDNDETNVSIIIPFKLGAADSSRTKFIRTGTGTVQITLESEDSSKLRSKNNDRFISVRYGQVELIYRKTEEYFLFGDLSAS